MSLTIKDETRIRQIFKEEFSIEFPKAFKKEFEATGTTRRLDALTDYLFNQTATKAELEELREKINLLPTKDEFFTAMDRLFAEIKTISQEQLFTGSRIDRLEERVDKLELQVAS